MPDMTSARRVSRMYVKNDTLTVRKRLHYLYSVNPYGWANWVFDQYAFHDGIRVLELACGTASMWQNRERSLPDRYQVILSDISPLMVKKAGDLLSGCAGFSFKEIDIQSIPYENGAFDMVIANHMLYHVPDQERALTEVRRVLRPGGRFYCATLGKNSLRELHAIYRKLEGKASFSYSENVSFTLENGYDLLRRHFPRIERKEYIDALEVTNIDDLIAYIQSYNEVSKTVQDELRHLIRSGFSADGAFHIRKEQGLFICE